MSIEDTPFYNRMMADGKGLLREEFIKYLRGVEAGSVEQHQSTTKHIRQVIVMYLQTFEENDFRRLLLREEVVDLAAEINRLRILLKPEPRSDGELYDQHVHLLRLISISKQACITLDAETELQQRITVGGFSKRWHTY